MARAALFNFERWGTEGTDHFKASEKMKAAGIEMSFNAGPIDKDHLPTDKDFEILGVFMDSNVSADVIAALPNLKLIATLSTGFDHIDVAAAAARGIAVSSVPAYGENTVAEFAFTLILALARKVEACHARVRDEGKFTTEGLQGFDLAGKTLGVLGTGRIGKHAVRIGKGFGMRVVAYDVFHDDAFAAEMGFPYLELPQLLAESDVITVHTPYLPSTHHLINKENIGLIKKGAYLINTARGAIVETSAVLGALKSGQLGGAGLDVLEEENAMRGAGAIDVDKELIMMPNVLVTPHNAFNTKEAFVRILDTTIDNIVGFSKGAPTNLVPVTPAK